ncbi:MAG: lipid A biosynthesis acyltransferase [Gammaproteobacteria bacterium]|nr:lipid A biosynthesis acyltransferase [Gammaproteobacteria bacterium]
MRKSASLPNRTLTRITLVLLWLVARLPHRVALALGGAGGRLYLLFSRRRRRVARINLELCFPGLTRDEHQALLRDHFSSLGQGIVEMAIGWWTDLAPVLARTEMEGVEHLTAAAARGRGVVLLSAHFTGLELGGALLNTRMPFAVVYRKHEHPVIQRTLARSRARLFRRAIPRNDIRQMLKALKEGEIVWFAADQHPRKRSGVMAGFFGIPTLTSTAPSRIARASGSPVVPFFPHRLEDGGYVLRILPELEGFPSGDEVLDATRINRIIEDEVRRAPHEYLWIHRRFKTIAGPHGDPYAPFEADD